MDSRTSMQQAFGGAYLQDVRRSLKKAGINTPIKSWDDVYQAMDSLPNDMLREIVSATTQSTVETLQPPALEGLDYTFYEELRKHALKAVRNAIRAVYPIPMKHLASWSLVQAILPDLSQNHRTTILDSLNSGRSDIRHRPYATADLRANLAQTPTLATIVEGEVMRTPPQQNAPSTGLLGPDETSTFRKQSLPYVHPLDPQSEYLKCVDRATCEASIQEFIDRTRNEALAQGVCCSCARQVFKSDLTAIQVGNIPHSEQLRPTQPHPSHALSANGLLLHGGPYTMDQEVTLCSECTTRLESNRRPPLSLANGLWVGDVPPELSCLSLPERILISLYFPSAYVVKLYPCGKRSVDWNLKNLHSGIRGNVSTYKLDQNLIAGMVGLTMPPPVAILSATMGITYVGLNKLPKAALPGTFSVNRLRIARALQWLKIHNPLYRNIEISLERLEQLPENGVPQNLLDNMRWEPDPNILDEEHATYVPLNEEEDNDEFLERLAAQDAMQVDSRGVEEVQDHAEEPEVIPLQSHGVVDVSGHSIPDNEIFRHALLNTTKMAADSRDSYKVKHGGQFINEYARRDPQTGLRYDGGPDNPAHLLGTFPYLFPYGKGGFEADQAISVSYNSHARWALQYDDGRFRKDMLFIFQVFGVIQKRQVCQAASLQVQGAPSYVNDRLKTLRTEDLVQASIEEAQNKPFSNPAIRTLRSQMGGVRSKVIGSDESRHSVRSDIWGTNLVCNNPALWVTINPPDTHNPIAQVFAGEEIDLDKFCKTAGPDAGQRARNIAQDPYAASKFFHHIIQLVLECLLGIKAGQHRGHIHRREGLFGTIQAYIGTVEAQGRGSLHFHLLLWLKDAPRPQEYKEALLSEAFRTKVQAFIRQNIHADIDNLDTADILRLKKDKEIAYCRPLDPRDAMFELHRAARIKSVARTLQFHVCQERVCVVLRRGKRVCKRRAPWPAAKDAWIYETGQWGPKRTSPYMNGFNPDLATTLACNHDVKLMTHGGATRTISWYITNYASKKQQKSSNTSALLAHKFAFHTQQEQRNPGKPDLNKRMLQRCVNALARDREFSAPEVISYLMGWGDRYLSHHTVGVRWDMAYRLLLKAYPGLKAEDEHARARQVTDSTTAPTEQSTEDAVETHTLQFVGGELEIRDQMKEYAYRGQALESDSLLKVLLDTYDAPYEPPKQGTTIEGGVTIPVHQRPRHDRIPYLETYGKPNRCRIRRGPKSETMPRIKGRWFPRNDDLQCDELYCASMLLLLTPWRTMKDLKRSDESFRTTFNRFFESASDWERTVLANIQHYYDCADAASAEATEERNNVTSFVPMEVQVRDQTQVVLPQDMDPLMGLTEGNVEQARQESMSERDRLHVREGLWIAESAGINIALSHHLAFEGPVNQATPDDLEDIHGWASTLKAITRNGEGLVATGSIAPPAEVLAMSTVGTAAPEVEEVVAAKTKTAVASGSEGLVNILNDEQRRAHDIIVRCMENELAGLPQEQLLMIVHGQGGTGKTLLIQAVTETLDHLNASRYLGKAATSGIAASPIGGTTVHSYFGLPINPQGHDWVSKATRRTQERRVENIAKKHIVFIDEMSMLTKGTLCSISEVCQIVRGQYGDTTARASQPFGGLHLVLFGDFHQFPPVANANNALYLSRPSDQERSAIGRALFEQFEIVVFLRQQNRSQDPEWTAILDRLRVGECTPEDEEEINKLVVTDPGAKPTDFQSPAWKDAILVTPRHHLRRAWNDVALRTFCTDHGLRRYIIQAQDTARWTGEKPRLDYRIAIAGMSWQQKEKLDDQIEIARGMKVMVLLNMATEADVANGTRGVIEDFWLDPTEEPQEQDDGSILLSKLPSVIFFRPNQRTPHRFPGVPAGLIPLTPVHVFFNVENGLGQVERFRRDQYAITGAYAFTDYKSQGQTIEKAIIDLTKAPGSSGELTPFNAYVALSRGRGRDHIRLLRPVPSELLFKHPSEELRTEMVRLEALDYATVRRYTSTT